MSNNPQVQAIEARQRQIAEEIARLKKESDENEIALLVVHRLWNEAGAVKSNGAAKQSDEDGALRPKGIPTNREMVGFVLASAEKEGRDGLTAAEIVAAIRSNYWPGLVGKQILPLIYHFAKKGHFKKLANGKFKRIKTAHEKAAEIVAAEPGE